MRIEFIGPCGVGKTTIIREMGIPKYRPEPAHFLDREASTFLNHVEAAYREARPSGRPNARKIARVLKQAIAADHCTKVVCSESLLGQKGLQMALDLPEHPDLVSRYFALMPVPALSVFMVGNPDLIRARNKERFELHGREDRSADVDNLLDVTYLALEVIRGPKLILSCSQAASVNAQRVIMAARL